MFKRFKVKKGDTVKVISGGNRGKEGTVLAVDRKKDRVVVEGVNIVTKHVKPSPANPQGGVTTTEAGIHISNVMWSMVLATRPVLDVVKATTGSWFVFLRKPMRS